MPEETETAKQIKGALGGIAEGLAAAFAPKKAPPKRERPTIPMKYVEKATEGQWDAPEPSWKDEEDSDYRVHGEIEETWVPADRYVGSTRSKGSRPHFDEGHN